MSIWGTLASVASSFIPGIGPFIAPIVGGLVGGLTSGGGTGGGTGNANPYSAQISKLETSLNAPGAQTDNAATDSAQNFYKTILSGSQANTRALLGPDVSTIMGQYDNAAKAATQLGPRGGGRDAVLADAPFQAAGAFTKLLGQAKSTAATGLAQIGQQKQQAATAARGQQVTQLGQLLGSNAEANRTALDTQIENNKQFGAMGAGIGSFMTNLAKNKGWGSGKSSDGSTTSGVSGYDPSNASSNTSSYDEFS